MQNRALIIFFAILLFPALAMAFEYTGWQQGPWQHITDTDGIKVYRNTRVAGGIHAYRCDVDINAPADEVLKVVLDHDRARARSFVTAYNVLHDDGKTTLVYQQIQRTGLGRREFTAAGRIVHPTAPGDPAGFTFKMVPGRDDPHVASFAAMEGSFMLTPVGPNRTRLSYRIFVDPDAVIPNFILRGALRGSAVEVVQKLRHDAER